MGNGVLEAALDAAHPDGAGIEDTNEVILVVAIGEDRGLVEYVADGDKERHPWFEAVFQIQVDLQAVSLEFGRERRGGRPTVAWRRVQATHNAV